MRKVLLENLFGALTYNWEEASQEKPTYKYCYNAFVLKQGKTFWVTRTIVRFLFSKNLEKDFLPVF